MNVIFYFQGANIVCKCRRRKDLREQTINFLGVRIDRDLKFDEFFYLDVLRQTN